MHRTHVQILSKQMVCKICSRRSFAEDLKISDRLIIYSYIFEIHVWALDHLIKPARCWYQGVRSDHVKVMFQAVGQNLAKNLLVVCKPRISRFQNLPAVCGQVVRIKVGLTYIKRPVIG